MSDDKENKINEMSFKFKNFPEKIYNRDYIKSLGGEILGAEENYLFRYPLRDGYSRFRNSFGVQPLGDEDLLKPIIKERNPYLEYYNSDSFGEFQKDSQRNIETAADAIITSPAFPRSEALRLEEKIRESDMTPEQVIEQAFYQVALVFPRVYNAVVIDRIFSSTQSTDNVEVIGAKSSPIFAGYTITNPQLSMTGPQFNLALNSELAETYKTRVLEEYRALQEE